MSSMIENVIDDIMKVVIKGEFTDRIQESTRSTIEEKFKDKKFVSKYVEELIYEEIVDRIESADGLLYDAVTELITKYLHSKKVAEKVSELLNKRLAEMAENGEFDDVIKDEIWESDVLSEALGEKVIPAFVENLISGMKK